MDWFTMVKLGVSFIYKEGYSFVLSILPAVSIGQVGQLKSIKFQVCS